MSKEGINWLHIIVAVIVAFLAYGFVMSYVNGSSQSQGSTPACYNYSGDEPGC